MFMEKKMTWSDTVALIVWALPLVYLIGKYPSLPATIPMHFGVNGNPDRIGSKEQFLLVVLGMSILGLAVALLIRFVPKIDPKKKAQYSPRVFTRISHGIVFLIALLTGLVVYAGEQGHFAMRESFILPVIALFVSFFGTMTGDVKPNYFVGIRTPWTLENDEVWKKTHQLAGKIFQPGGVVLAVLTLVLAGHYAYFVFIAGMLLMTLIPVVYSYRLYHRLQK